MRNEKLQQPKTDIESTDRPFIQIVVMQNDAEQIFTRSYIMTDKHLLETTIREQIRYESIIEADKRK